MKEVVSDEEIVLYDEADNREEDKATSQLLEQNPDDPLSAPKRKCVQPGGLKFIVTGSIIFALGVTVALIVDIYTGERNLGGGAVSSDAKECSVIGEDVLKQGGSAVDAAIATTLCIGVICLESSGIGGGGFMLVQSPEGEVKVIDFREVAPSAATKNMFKKDSNASRTGGLAVAVPGLIRGLELAHQKFGKLKWSELVNPSINIAKNGFKIHATANDITCQAKSSVWQRVKGGFQSILAWFVLFTSESGGDVMTDWVPILTAQMRLLGYIQQSENVSPPYSMSQKYLSEKSISNDLSPELKDIVKNPQLIKQPLLAETLERISSQGASGFYEGPVAKSIVETIKNHSGIMTLEDLKNYSAKIREPLISEYHNYRLFTAGPPSSGAVVVSALNILEGFNLTLNGNKTDKLDYHYLVEALKFSYAQRSHLADPDFVEMKNVTEMMTSKKEAEKLRHMINKTRTYNTSSHYGPFFQAPPNKGTAHVTVMGKGGGLVAITSTLNGPFGSKLYTPSGVVLNNEMDDFANPGVSNYFAVQPAEINFIKPGKRPLSSISPVIALSKSDLCGHQIVLGSAGGSRIPSAIIQVLLNMLSYNRNLSSAIEWPRLHHQLLPMVLEAEGERFSKEPTTKGVIEYLRKVGNKINTSPKFLAVVNGAIRKHGQLHAWADGRRGDNGVALF